MGMLDDHHLSGVLLSHDRRVSADRGLTGTL
jgi:hypothetical protein